MKWINWNTLIYFNSKIFSINVQEIRASWNIIIFHTPFYFGMFPNLQKYLSKCSLYISMNHQLGKCKTSYQKILTKPMDLFYFISKWI